MQMRSVAAKRGLHIVAVWVEDEGGVVMRPALARRPIIGSTCLEGCGVKGIHLRPIHQALHNGLSDTLAAPAGRTPSG
jgi:hypothetical protein